MPRALASLLRATTQPSLLLSTTTGLFSRSGRKMRSQLTKKLLQSMSAKTGDLRTAVTCFLAEPEILQLLLAHYGVSSSSTHSPYLGYASLRASLLPCTASKCVSPHTALFSCELLPRFNIMNCLFRTGGLWLLLHPTQRPPWLAYAAGR